MELPVRKDIRLRGYDYSKSGRYFITICVKDRHELLWELHVGARIARPQLSDIGKAIEKARPQLSDIGKVIEKAIDNIPHIYESVTIDKYVIMPNHIHMILMIGHNCGRAMRAPTISMIINQMKGYVSKQVGYSVWQKLFHDHIIRDDIEYQRILQYMDENPARWNEDEYYTQ